MSLRPFSVILSVVSGDPNGLKVVEHSDWYGKALMFPRSILPSMVAKREEFLKSAVYLLIGPSEDGLADMLYIGEADPVGDRLQNHYQNKDFWTKAVFFTGSGDQLNKTHVKFLEAKLVQLGHKAKRFKIENKTVPTLPSLSESERIRAESFLAHILEILPLLGVSAFELGISIESGEASLEIVQATHMHGASEPLQLRGKGIEACGMETTAGFLVRQRSEAVLEPVPSMEPRVGSYYQLRSRLIDQGVLERNDSKLSFTQDYVFDSPSAAAAVILGRSTNGRVEWKTSDGRTLKSIQEQVSSGGFA